MLLNVEMSVGVLVDDVLPRPNCPLLPTPHAYTCPLAVSARLWLLPAAIADDTAEGRDEHGTRPLRRGAVAQPARPVVAPREDAPIPGEREGVDGSCGQRRDAGERLEEFGRKYSVREDHWQ